MPPHYDPEFTLPAEEKESRRARREAESQLALARASADWAQSHGVAVPELSTWIHSAETALAASDLSEAFWGGVDSVWTTIRSQVPVPTSLARPAPPPPPASAAEAATAPDGP